MEVVHNVSRMWVQQDHVHQGLPPDHLNQVLTGSVSAVKLVIDRVNPLPNSCEDARRIQAESKNGPARLLLHKKHSTFQMLIKLLNNHLQKIKKINTS
jgi:hypothetical protein